MAGFPQHLFSQGIIQLFCLGRRAKSSLLSLSSPYLVLGPLHALHHMSYASLTRTESRVQNISTLQLAFSTFQA